MTSASNVVRTKGNPFRQFYEDGDEGHDVIPRRAVQSRKRGGGIYDVATTLSRISNIERIIDLKRRAKEAEITIAPVGATVQQTSSDRQIHLSSILTRGSKIASLLFLFSIYSWAYLDFSLINPYISLLGLVACPFFYWMGRIARVSK